MIDVALTDAQDLVVICKPTNTAGRPAQLQADTFSVLSDTPDVISDGTVDSDGTPDASGNFVYSAKSIGHTIGQARLTVSGDADLGDGVETIQEQIEVTITADKANNLGIQASPVAKA